MITIVGDNFEELADVQAMIETAVLHSSKPYENDTVYKLSSGNPLLVDEYNHIVGEKSKSEEAKLDTDHIKIPEGARINSPFTPEEVNDIATLFDLDIENNKE